MRCTASERASRADRWVFSAGFALSVLLHLAALLYFRAAPELAPGQPPRLRPPAEVLTAVALRTEQREAPLAPAPAAAPRVPARPPPLRLPPPLAKTAAAEPDAASPPPPAALQVDSVVPAPRAEPRAELEKSRGEYERQIAQAVERKREYPLAARRRRQEGTAIVRLRLAEDGSLIAAQIVRDSGHALLDRAALGMVTRAAPFPRAPAELRQSQLEILLPIQFTVR